MQNVDDNARWHSLAAWGERAFSLCETGITPLTDEHNQMQSVIRFAGPPVVVGVTMYVLSISSLSEVQMV